MNEEPQQWPNPTPYPHNLKIQMHPQTTPSEPQRMDREGKTKIFKYPYLFERSYEKIKQDNHSEKSIEKNVRQSHQRRKIFEPRSTIESEMKYSSMSADDRNRKNGCEDFQSNPVRHKIKNSRNRSIGQRRSEQSSFTHSFPMQQPVIFNYTSPQPQLFYPNQPGPICKPVVSYQIGQVGPLTTNRPMQTYIEKHPIGYYSMPANPGPNQQRNPPLLASSYEMRPRPDHEIRPVVVQSQINGGNFRKEVPTLDHPHLQREPAKPVNNNLNLFSSFGMGRANETPQLANTRAIAWQPKKAQSSDHPLEAPKTLKHSHMVEQAEPRKASPNRTPAPNIQHSVHRNMYETYKVGQRFKDNNLLHPQSPTKDKSRKHHPPPSVSSFASASVSASQEMGEESVDLHEAEDLDEAEVAKYSDRFFDMDFKDTKKQHHHKHQSKNADSDHRASGEPESANKLASSHDHIELKKLSSQRKQYEQKSQGMVKKNTITSIALQKQKQSLKKLGSLNIRAQSSLPHELEKRSALAKLRQGNLIPYLLIAMGFTLVLIQILK